MFELVEFVYFERRLFDNRFCFFQYKRDQGIIGAVLFQNSTELRRKFYRRKHKFHFSHNILFVSSGLVQLCKRIVSLLEKTDCFEEHDMLAVLLLRQRTNRDDRECLRHNLIDFFECEFESVHIVVVEVHIILCLNQVEFGIHVLSRAIWISQTHKARACEYCF